MESRPRNFVDPSEASPSTATKLASEAPKFRLSQHTLKQRITDEHVTGRVYKVTRWLLFGVIIGLLPFAFPFVNIFASEAQPDIVSWAHIRNTLFGRGDLLLIGATLVAASAGDLIGSGREREGGKIIAGFSCFVIFIICVVWYGIVADKIEAHAVYNRVVV